MINSHPLATHFLRDKRHGGAAGQLSTVAGELGRFVDAATTSIDIAIYDFRLTDPHAVSTVVGALTRAANRGLPVRIGFDAGKPAVATAATFARLEADPAPPGTADWVAAHFGGTAVLTKAIHAGSQLMHSKYVIRDAGSSSSTPAVWTGSTNFTDDAWTLQENNVLTVSSPTVVSAYRTDFDELWAAGAISKTGKGDSGTTSVGAGTVGWDFCPGDGAQVNADLAARVAAASTRLIIAAMVLTSHEVLSALSAAIGRGVPLTGIYDGGQMDPIVKEWKASGNTAVLADWTTVSAELAHKQSVPYSPAGPHDFMHLKVLVADDTVTTGSYNFSANAEHNAENQLHLDDPATVKAYVNFLTAVIAAYS
jgi:phosphatidylserine/phosphatidylglycerophosphate/cardiolipin synthase-like enzyme